MANERHLDLLAKGVDAWNEWRARQQDVHPDLSNAHLRYADLRGINLGTAMLTGADLTSARLSSANLSRACASHATLVNADLRTSQLQGADMRFSLLVTADLSGVDLKFADLSHSDLSGSYLRGSTLCRTIIENARFRGTTLADLDLREFIGLETIQHAGPSTIGVDTLYRSQGQIPGAFLRGAGVPESLIAYMKSLTGSALEFYSVFISYSTKDQDFAHRLCAQLQARGVRSWFAPHHLHGGRKMHEQIDEAINVSDKLLLILSDASMGSNWVKAEVANARAKEQQQKRQILFPITLVPFERLREWRCIDSDTGIDRAREIREYFVPDFSDSKDPDSYGRAFEQLVRDLKGGAATSPGQWSTSHGSPEA